MLYKYLIKKHCPNLSYCGDASGEYIPFYELNMGTFIPLEISRKPVVFLFHAEVLIFISLNVIYRQYKSAQWDKLG